MIRFASYAVDWDLIPIPLQQTHFNNIVKQVAQDCKDFLHAQFYTLTWDQLQKLVSSDQHAAFMHLQYLHIAARLVWQNNVALAKKLIFEKWY